MREDYETLSKRLGFTDAELRELGLLEPARESPDRMAEAYIRRSNAREDTASLKGQLKDVARHCATHGLTIRRVWFEQLSASKKSVTRREYAKALNAVLDGKSKVFAVWKLDRFDRQGAGSVISAVDRLDERRCRLITVKEGLDSAVKGSRMLFSIFAERAKEEAEDISMRVENGHREHKALGRRGTGVPPFGCASEPGSGTVYPHPTEYMTARRIAKMVLDGLTTVEVAYEANAQGLRTRSGQTWSSTAVSKLVQSPVFAGMVPQRERQQDEYGNKLDVWSGYGEPVYGEDGEPLLCGDGVISPDEFFKIRMLIRGRTNPFARRGKRLGTYLLSESLRCPRCKGSSHGGGGKYHCATRQTRGPAVCEGFTTTSDRLDEYVSGVWVAHVISLEPDSDELYEIGERLLRFTDPELEARVQAARLNLDDARARLTELEDRYWNPRAGMGRMSAETYERQSHRLTETIRTLEGVASAQRGRADVSPLLEPESLAELFNGHDLVTQRALIRAVWPLGITLDPASGRGDRRPLQDRVIFVTSGRDSG